MSEVVVQEEAVSEATNQSKTKKRIALIFTGGTIAVTTDTNAGLVPNLKGKEVLERIPEVGKYLPDVEFEVFDFATLPGPHMSPEMMLTLRDFVRVAGDDSDGIVITHGTDSMEETAYFLDLTLASTKAVVVTGAMHHSLDTAWDGGSNIIDAIAVASSSDFTNEGVLIVMNSTIHHAAEVTKAHTMRTDTFRSPEYGPLGTVNTLSLGTPEKLRSSKFRQHIMVGDDNELPYVEIFKTYTGMDDMLISCAITGGAKGLVFEAMGQGNVPPGAINGIAKAREMRIPVVITSRCPSGPVRPYYAYPGAGRELQKLGCLFAPYLNGQKARLKLILAIAAGLDESELASLFPLA